MELAPTRRTTRSSPMPTATSPTSIRTSSRGATTASTGRKPVDGSDPATEWRGALLVDGSPNLLNPAERLALEHQQLALVGGRARTARQARTSRYMDTAGENPARHPRDRVLRTEGLHARLGSGAAYDSLPARASRSDPGAAARLGRAARRDPLKTKLASRPNRSRSVLGLSLGRRSVPTSLAIFWGEALRALAWRRRGAGHDGYAAWRRRRRSSSSRRSPPRRPADGGLRQLGTPWGEINRFQRLTGDIVQPFNDAAPSIPVGFASARWGSLASFGGA